MSALVCVTERLQGERQEQRLLSFPPFMTKKIHKTVSIESFVLEAGKAEEVVVELSQRKDFNFLLREPITVSASSINVSKFNN